MRHKGKTFKLFFYEKKKEMYYIFAFLLATFTKMLKMPPLFFLKLKFIVPILNINGFRGSKNYFDFIL